MKSTNDLVYAAMLTFGSFMVPSAAIASLVTWTLNDVAFNDGGMAEGYFIFDTVADDIAGYNIVTTNGTMLPGTNYDSTTSSAAVYTPDCFGIGTTCLNFFDGSPADHQLAFGFTGSLTEVTPKVIPDPPTSEGSFSEVTTEGEASRNVTQAWRLQPSPVPIPAATWLFGSGLIGLIGLARSKQSI